MLEWLIGVIAKLLGVSPLAAVAVLVAASLGLSAALRWHRRVRQDEYLYLNLTQQLDLVQTSGAAIDPFTLQSTEDPRLRQAPAGAAGEAAPPPAQPRATPRPGARSTPRIVMRKTRPRRS